MEEINNMNNTNNIKLYNYVLVDKYIVGYDNSNGKMVDIKDVTFFNPTIAFSSYTEFPKNSTSGDPLIFQTITTSKVSHVDIEEGDE